MADTMAGPVPDPEGPGWRRFFASFAARYDDEGFTQATEDELVFLAELLDLSPGTRVLDVGCGTGRHAVPIAAMGAEVTGLDQSPAMLERAAARAGAAGAEVTWVEADAREVPDHLGAFDVVLCLCEGRSAWSPTVSRRSTTTGRSWPPSTGCCGRGDGWC